MTQDSLWTTVWPPLLEEYTFAPTLLTPLSEEHTHTSFAPNLPTVQELFETNVDPDGEYAWIALPDLEIGTLDGQDPPELEEYTPLFYGPNLPTIQELWESTVDVGAEYDEMVRMRNVVPAEIG